MVRGCTITIHPRSVSVNEALKHARKIAVRHLSDDGDIDDVPGSREDWELIEQLSSCGIKMGIQLQEYLAAALTHYMNKEVKDQISLGYVSSLWLQDCSLLYWSTRKILCEDVEDIVIEMRYE